MCRTFILISKFEKSPLHFFHYNWFFETLGIISTLRKKDQRINYWQFQAENLGWGGSGKSKIFSCECSTILSIVTILILYYTVIFPLGQIQPHILSTWKVKKNAFQTLTPSNLVWNFVILGESSKNLGKSANKLKHG